MEFGILGPLEVSAGGRSVEVGGPKPRAVLALLLVHANEVVSAERLIEDLWEQHPPRSAAATLQTYISQLRKRLGLALQTRPTGYCLGVEPDALDAARFERLVSVIGQGDDRGPGWVVEQLDEALGCWRGPALVDFAGASWAEPEVARLEGLRLLAIGDRIDARLALGSHARVVSELEILVAANPLRERLWAQLMLALYRSDRQPDALRAYSKLRAHLGEELGIEPSSELARLEQSILLHEPELDWRPPAPAQSAPTVESRAGLPTGVVTFMLTDVVGSTRLWDEQPAAMADALAIHDAFIAGVVDERGGRLLKQRGEGDSTFAVFTRATDALAAAVDAQRSLADQSWPTGVEVSVRMAIHTGEAIERDGDYYGTTVNRAARLRGQAEGGQVLVSQSTVELLVDHLPAGIALVELGPRSLQGLRRLEHVYAVVSASSPQTSGEEHRDEEIPIPGPLERPRTEPFIGRTEELAMLEKAWQAARAGDRHAVLLSGEPGIGKTHLAAELAHRVRAGGGLVLYGRCDDELGIAFQPFTEALRHYVGSCTPRTLYAAAGDGLSQLSRLLPELQTMIPGLPPPRLSDPETERYELFEGIISVFANVSRTAPIVLVLDDLHWATKPTLLLLRHLLRANTRMSLLVVGTYRSTEATGRSVLGEMLPDLRSAARVETVTLHGFSAHEVGEYLSSATGMSDEQAVPARSLQRDTNGNPLFVREMVRSFAEHEGSSGAAGESLIADSVPQSVRDVIELRLARLSEPARRTLAVAAVIGPSPRVDLLEQIADATTGSPTVLDAIDEAIEAGIVIEPTSDTDTLEFTHALIRRTIYTSLTAARRTRLHQRVAQALESLGDIEDDDERLPALAYHAGQGARLGLGDKAAGYALLAGQQALTRLAFEETVEHLQRGLHALESGASPNRVHRAQLWFAIGETRWVMGDAQGTKDAARRAWDEAVAAHDTELLVRAVVLHSDQDEHFGSWDISSDELLEKSLALVDENQTSRVLILAMRAYRQGGRGEHEAALASSREALDLANDSGDQSTRSMALHVYVECLLGSPHVEQRLALAEELLSSTTTDNDSLYCVARFDVQHARAELGDLHGFEEFIEELPRQHTRLQFFDPHLRRLNLETGGWYQAANRAFLAMLRGSWTAADKHSGRVLEGARQIPGLFSLYSGQRFHSRREQGRGTEIVVGARRAIEYSPLPVFRAALALVLADLGELGESRVLLEQLRTDDFARLPRGVTWTGTLAYLSEVSAVVGDKPSAESLRSLFEPHSGHLVILANMVACTGAVDRYLAMLETTLGRWSDAEQHFGSALELERRVESEPLIARTQYWYGSMLKKRDWSGDQARAGELLASSRRTAVAFGMARLAEQAHAELSATD